MKKRLQIVLGLLCFSTIAAWLPGCGNTAGTEAPLEVRKMNGIEYGLLEQGTLAMTDNRVSGTGAIIARDPRHSQDNNYALSFSLEPGGSLKLVTNSDRKLQSGVSLTFSRPSTRNLKIVLAVGSESYDISGDFPDLAADRPFRVEVDVHGHGHLFIWAGDQELEYAFSTRVSGNLWGVRLEKASLTEAKAGRPKKEH